jgi:hypothetical protein
VGLVVPSLRVLYDYSWFVGFAVAFGAYYGMMRLQSEVYFLPSLAYDPVAVFCCDTD